MGATHKTGTYILILENLSTQSIQIGKLGILTVNPGFYVYVGSAFGPGGIPARSARHKNRQKRLHWHIDYLRKNSELLEIWFSLDQTRREHQWADIVRQTPGIQLPMHGFGASDCQCPTHLFYSTSKPDINYFREKTHLMAPGANNIQVEMQFNKRSTLMKI